VPTITLNGPASVQAGSLNTYEIVISDGPATTAGLNLSLSPNSGELIPVSGETQIFGGELSHVQPKPFTGGQARFSFQWRVPAASQSVTMYVAGNSANGNSLLTGDGINSTQRVIQVTGGPPPTATPTPAPVANQVTLTKINNQNLSRPLHVTHAGDDRLFVVEQTGRIRILNPNGTVRSQPFLNLSSKVTNSNGDLFGNEMGLLGLAFHPDYRTNGYFFVYYTPNDPRRTVVSRFKVSQDPNLADPNSETVLLEFDQPYTNHNGGHLVFGPDRYLYIASGDGGSGGDPQNNAQNGGNLLGKILRIDVDKTTGRAPDCGTTSNYTVPHNNFFADGDGGQGCDEIWAMGLRNPWRFSIDSLTGDVWIGDVGQNNWEEIDVVPAGTAANTLNFGWRCYEGNQTYNTQGCQPQSSYRAPVYVYNHSQGCSVTGGAVYRGGRYPDLYGAYFFTDFCQPSLRALTGGPAQPAFKTVPTNGGNLVSPVSFGEDRHGELYVVGQISSGAVFRLEGQVQAPPTPTPEPFPTPTPGGASSRVYLPLILSTGESQTTASYEADESDFLNPERGFHGNADILDETDLSWIRSQGHTLARAYIRLDDYRDQPLSDTFLVQLRNSLANARSAGIKLVLRFSYNFGIAEADASLSRVEQHIQQLRPILADYQDVIVVLQAGFIGAWGEWHSSTHGLDTPANKARVLAALLAALPDSRMVQLRYPGDLIDNFPQPLTTAEAYSASAKARTGHHNDCFLASADDVGTYWPPERQEEFRDYLAQMTAYTPTGGETCQVSPAEHRTDCPTALAEMARFHWSYLNYDFYRPDIDRWKTEGCFDEISKRLGYRYRLLNASVDRQGRAGEPLALQLRLTNSGFARLYNPRPAELVLRQAATGAERKVIIREDVRGWLPGPAETTTLSVAATLPGDLPTGDYDLLLNLPDSASNLSSLPAYSIRLANQGVWEAGTGYNDLGLRTSVTTW
jgi:glucose/arabinose dehydrogenase